MPTPKKIKKTVKNKKSAPARVTHHKPSLDDIRHSLAHILAAAVLKKYPSAHLGIGPVIEDGFYYDIKTPRPITLEDLPHLEKTMREIINQHLDFTGKVTTPATAKKVFKDQPYKLELIDDLKKKKEIITVYATGDLFTDLCRGGHVHNTREIAHDAFALTKISGAYWKGDSHNDQLTRIYGVAFKTKQELESYLKRLAEAQKRDHKILGPRLGLFLFHETSPGMPYWLPKGMIVINELLQFWREEHAARGYQEISTPLINKKELWEQSGHWEHYKENMFMTDFGDGEIYGLKAMNCPNAMIVFGSETRSYRNLPLRFSDTDILHRYELSGTLNGLLRVRSFRQDDSHNFVTEDQVGEEYNRILEIAHRFYTIFGLKYRLRLGTRPEKYMGDITLWNKAEKSLKAILKQRIGAGKYEVAEKDGAFYGPKIDIIMEDAIGRDWQMGTIQLDFQQPKRFNLEYIDANGKKKTPVVIHRVIYGSIDRFLGVLIEHTAGHLPTWLSPVQVTLINVGDNHRKYAVRLHKRLIDEGIRSTLSDSNMTVSKRIREAEMYRSPYIIVVGDREVHDGTVSVRYYRNTDTSIINFEDFLCQIKSEIKQKK